MERFTQILNGSAVFRLLLWLGAQWRSCWLMRRLLRPLGTRAAALYRRVSQGAGRLWRESGPPLLRGSAAARPLLAFSDWCGRQWRKSGAVRAFLTPSSTGRAVSENSIFSRLGRAARRLLCLIYDKLHLERAADGSIFHQLWLLALLPAALAPLLPTMAAAALCMAAWLALVMRLAADRTRPLAYAPMNKYIALYAAVYVVCTLCSVDVRSSLPVGALTVFFTLFVFVVQNAVSTRRQLILTVNILVLAATAVSLYGIYQYIFRVGYQSQAWVDSGMFGAAFRVASTLQNPNMLGQYLVLMIPLGGACLLTAKGAKQRLLWLACCAVMCVCMLLTFSRGAWLALLCAGLLFFALLQPRLLLLAPLAVAALFILLPDAVVARFVSIGDRSDTSTNYRVFIWLGTLDMLRDYGLSGVGPGTEAFNVIYPAYDYGAIITPHSHNLFLQIACDAGVCALALFLITAFCFLKDVACALCREADRRLRILLIAFLSGAAGFFVQGMTDYSFYNYRVLLLFWIFLGLGAAAARLSREGGDGA